MSKGSFWAIIVGMIALTVSNTAGYYEGRADAKRHMKLIVEGYVAGAIDAHRDRLKNMPQ